MRANADRFLIQERSLHRGRRKDDGIHARLRESRVKLLEELFLNLLRLQVVRRWDFAAYLQSGTHIVTVLRGPRRKISLLLMVNCRFHPCDMIPRVFSFIEQRDGNVFRHHARAAKFAQSGVKAAPDLLSEGIEEQLARNPQTKLSGSRP